VASIRKFDLRYGEEIKQLFVREPSPEFQDPEFSSVRHLNIPSLSENEIDQISAQSPELFAFLKRAPKELLNLLRVPFSLQLVAELVEVGDIRNELLSISTQLGLLNQYWLRRVISSDDRVDAREAVLNDVCENMVAERALRVNRSVVARPETSALLRALLSTQVLVEWNPSPEMPPERYILVFAHHVLFDYAVARLLFRGDPKRTVNRILKDPDLVVVIRPSLLLHFRHLWTVGFSQFWNLIFQVNQAAGIPEIGKLIGPSVAAELASGLYDLEPLLLVLENPRSGDLNAAEQAIRDLVGALLARAPSEARLFGPEAGPWCELLERVSRISRSPVACSVQPLLSIICDHYEDLDCEQRAAAGLTARRHLEFAWSQTIRNRWLIIRALKCVCRTFESDPTASAALIRVCLEPHHISQFGFEEMPWLADDAERLIPLDPGLVEEIYRVAFSHLETSKETTPLGQSRILPLSSNRQQDYDMMLRKLAKVFPQFLESAPEKATFALIAVMEAYVAQRHPQNSGKWHEETIEFEGIQAHIRTDYSAIWDHHVYRHEAPLQMLDTFQQYLEELCKAAWPHPETSRTCQDHRL
jgi:hypothetical protein